MKENHSPHSILILSAMFMALFLFTDCKDKTKSGSMEKSAVMSTTNEKIEGWPTPDSYTHGIPVYDKFEVLAPLFRLENDTTYVINFWATWCKPCIKELPYFEELNATLKNKKAKVVLVSLDFPKQVETQLVPFVEKQQLKSEVIVLLDGKYNDWINKVSPSWSGAIPATYIYKNQQNLLVADPFENLKELSEVVKPFL